MGSSNIRDILTSFSPSLDFFAISTGDGRIKMWDTVKGQVQTEFADIVSNETRHDLFTQPKSGHLSVDFKCMAWLSPDKKKKRKLGTSLLVLGTGSGDVLALDVAAGQLKWRVNDCHPGCLVAEHLLHKTMFSFLQIKCGSTEVEIKEWRTAQEYKFAS